MKGGPPASQRPSPGSPSSARRSLPLLIALAVPVVATLVGLPYYLLPQQERVRSTLHPLLRSSGAVGLAFGIAGFLMFLFMWLYPLRKKWRWLAFSGAISRWLDVHIVAGLSIPLIVAVHAGWRFEGLIGLGYAALLLVSASGIVGRYLYVHIPRSQSGLELSLEEVANARRTLVTEIAVATGLDPFAVERALAVDPPRIEGGGLGSAFARMLVADVSRWRSIRALRREWARPRSGTQPLDRRVLAKALRLARRQMALSQQVAMLEAARRVFGFWHVAHRPVAITALLAIVVHVSVVVAVGAVGMR